MTASMALGSGLPARTSEHSIEMSQAIRSSDALVVIDPQIDFLPGGSLPVQQGDRIFRPLNAVMPKFRRVYATRDWHPIKHKSFKTEGGPWPHHCVQNTPGAKFSPKLNIDRIHLVISKGTDADADGYSAFDRTDFDDQLRADGVGRLFVAGLATDYCVKATALEARRIGFDVIVLTDAIAAVNARPGDEEAALAAMHDAGCLLIPTTELV